MSASVRVAGNSTLPPMTTRRIAVIGAGAAGSMAAIFAAAGRRRDAAARADARRRPEDSHQRRRPLQHPPRPRRRDAVRHRLLAAHPAQHPALLAAGRADRLLRARARPAAGRGARDGQAVSRVEPRARRARRAARAGRARGVSRFMPDTRVTGLCVRTARAGGSSASEAAPHRGGRGRSSRPADSRCRRPAATAPGSRCSPRWATRSTRPTPRSRRSWRSPRSSARSAGVSLPVADHRPGWSPQRVEQRRLPVHPPRIQRARGAGRVARRGARRGPTATRAARLQVRWTALDEAAWEAALRPAGTRTVAGALRRELPERLADALADAGRRGADAAAGPAPPGGAAAADRRCWCGRSCRGPATKGIGRPRSRAAASAWPRSHPRTLESRRHPGLYICGEVLDAFGPIGGYNFLWAWATGRAAGLGAVDGRVVTLVAWITAIRAPDRALLAGN